MADAVPMIIECYRHQVPWDVNEHSREMVTDGVYSVRGESYIMGQYLAESQDDLPPRDSYISLDPPVPEGWEF